MNSNDVQTLYEEIMLYDLCKVDEDGTETVIGTTHIPDVAISFSEEHDDCIIRRYNSIIRLMELESMYGR